MDYGKMLGEAFEYAQEGLVGKWMKWLLLLVATILLALPLLGYELKILRGEKPAPEVSDWGTLFIALIQFIGVIRFARTGKMGEAFNFGEILTTIEKIGWVPYITAILIMIIV